MIKHRLLLPILLLLFAGFALRLHAGTYYTIQVASFPMGQTNEALALFKKLKADGWLTWYYKKGVGESDRIRIRAGAYSSKKEALSALKALQDNYGKDAFLDQANLPESISSKGMKIIVTPSSLWGVQAGKNTLLAELRQKSGGIPYNVDKDFIGFSLSGDGNTLMFSSLDGELLMLDIATRKAKVVHDDVLAPEIKWSPDGKWVAFTDIHDFESIANLYVMKADGSGKTAITEEDYGWENGIEPTTVCDFFWSLDSQALVYMNGNTYGTVLNESSICISDLKGKKKTLAVSTDKNVVILDKVGPDNRMFYRLRRKDESDRAKGTVKAMDITKSKP